MKRRLLITSLGFVVFLASAAARADLVVSISSPTIAAGGKGEIDVFLTSNAPDIAPDMINNYGFTLQISGPNYLKFSTTQNFSYLSSGQYVFAGDSTDATTSSDGGAVAPPGMSSVYPGDTFVGSDSTYSGNPVSLSVSNTPVLLAALTLDAGITAPGDIYSVTLTPPNDDGSTNASTKTYFDVFDFTNTGQETSAVAYTSTSGLVTISAAAVPEPATLVSGLTAILIGAGVCVMRGAGMRRGR